MDIDDIESLEDLTVAVSRIVIAVDLSPALIKGSEYVSRIFPKATYHLINVINISDRAIVLTHEYKRTLEKYGHRALKKIEGILRKNGVIKIHRHLREGKPHREILELARIEDANLIVMGTRTRKEEHTQAIGVGSTSRRVIERTKIPVFLFTPQARTNREPRLILNPSSGSKYSFKASMLAIRLASMLGLSVMTLYIGSDDPDVKFRHVIEYARSLGVKYSIKVAEGDPGHCIIEHSKKADIMIASRGRPGIGYKFRFLNPELALGKLEREVLGLSAIPILLIPD